MKLIKLINNYSTFLNYTFDKNKLKELISWFTYYYGEKETFSLLETFKVYGYKKATEAGISLSFHDLKNQNIENLKKDIKYKSTFLHILNIQGKLAALKKTQIILNSWNQTNDKIFKELSINLKKEEPYNSITLMAFSGARGNISQVRQLMGMRGLMADAAGNILDMPIQTNFKDGISLTEYFISCYGARKGVIDTALRTAKAGYLTRRLIFIVQHLFITKFDCFTNEGFWVKFPLKDEKQEKLKFLGRTLLKINSNFLEKNMLISSSTLKFLKKEQLQITYRSTLTCTLPKSICQLCYGWDLSKGVLIDIGEAVGICAGQSIGEPGTQLTMRTFHTGGVGVLASKGQYFIKAPFDGIIYFKGIQEILGNIIYAPGVDSTTNYAFMLSYERSSSFCKFPEKFFLELKPDDPKKNSFFLYKDQLPPKSLLFVQQYEKIKKNRILAQIPNIEDHSLDFFQYPTRPDDFNYKLHFYKAPFEGKIILLDNKLNQDNKAFSFSWIASSKIIENFYIHLNNFVSCLKSGDFVNQQTLFLEQQYFSPKTGKLYIASSLKKNSLDLALSSIFERKTYIDIGSLFCSKEQKLMYWILNMKKIQWFQLNLNSGPSSFSISSLFFNFEYISYFQKIQTFENLKTKRNIWYYKEKTPFFQDNMFLTWLQNMNLQICLINRLFHSFYFSPFFKLKNNIKILFFSFSKNNWSYNLLDFENDIDYSIERQLNSMISYHNDLNIINPIQFKNSIKNPIYIKQDRSIFQNLNFENIIKIKYFFRLTKIYYFYYKYYDYYFDINEFINDYFSNFTYQNKKKKYFYCQKLSNMKNRMKMIKIESLFQNQDKIKNNFLIYSRKIRNIYDLKYEKELIFILLFSKFLENFLFRKKIKKIINDHIDEFIHTFIEINLEILMIIDKKNIVIVELLESIIFIMDIMDIIEYEDFLLFLLKLILEWILYIIKEDKSNKLELKDKFLEIFLMFSFIMINYYEESIYDINDRQELEKINKKDVKTFLRNFNIIKLQYDKKHIIIDSIFIIYMNFLEELYGLILFPVNDYIENIYLIKDRQEKIDQYNLFQQKQLIIDLQNALNLSDSDIKDIFSYDIVLHDCFFDLYREDILRIFLSKNPYVAESLEDVMKEYPDQFQGDIIRKTYFPQIQEKVELFRYLKYALTSVPYYYEILYKLKIMDHLIFFFLNDSETKTLEYLAIIKYLKKNDIFYNMITPSFFEKKRLEMEYILDDEYLQNMEEFILNNLLECLEKCEFLLNKLIKLQNSEKNRQKNYESDYYKNKYYNLLFQNVRKNKYLKLKYLKIEKKLRFSVKNFFKKSKPISFLLENSSFQIISFNKLSLSFTFNLKKRSFFFIKKRWAFSMNKFLISGHQLKSNGEINTIKFKNKNRYTVSIIDFESIATIEKEKENIDLGFLGVRNIYGDLLSIFPSNLIFPLNGQIIKRTKKELIVQKGSPFSLKSTIILKDQFIKKDNVLSYHYSLAEHTQDITQGLPKIEKFFEARMISEIEANEVLNLFYEQLAIYGTFKPLIHKKIGFLMDSKQGPFEQLSKNAIKIIQIFYIDKIIQAYKDQGVFLNEKHIELIVREMTNKVRIVDGFTYGFISGEYYDFQIISKLNKLFYNQNLKEIMYSPAILGLTWSTKKSHGFLVSLSFQEMRYTLVSKSSRNQFDFLLGLHENLLLSRHIYAGTGIYLDSI
uniref:RNA polymerase subunit beta'' n=1 Tax=Prototheca tumulicola TaxID=1737639 RepID=UPI0030021BBA